METSLDTALIAIAHHSGFGHTARQAEAVARGAGSVAGAWACLLDVARLDDALWESLAAADAIIFGTPTYMGSPSAPFTAFADATAKVWSDGMAWRDKIAAGSPDQRTSSEIGEPSSILTAQPVSRWVASVSRSM